MKIVKLIVCALFGLMFINFGLDKFLHFVPMPALSGELAKVTSAIASVEWLMPLVGTIEIIGGLLFIFPKTRALGAIVILPVMAGIILHTAIYMPQGLGLPLVLLIINLWIIIDNTPKYKPMVS